MPSIIDICNLALDKIGAEGTLVSLDDKIKEARLCKKHYDMSRASVLSQHPWKFAHTRVVISPIVTAPVFGPTYQYTLPVDCLVVRMANDTDTVWTVEGRSLLCESSTVNLEYTANITDPNLFHPQFCDNLAYHLAQKICYALTQSNERENFLVGEVQRVAKAARFSDAVQNSPTALIADLFDNVRIGPNRGYVRDPQT